MAYSSPPNSPWISRANFKKQPPDTNFCKPNARDSPHAPQADYVTSRTSPPAMPSVAVGGIWWPQPSARKRAPHPRKQAGLPFCRHRPASVRPQVCGQSHPRTLQADTSGEHSTTRATTATTHRGRHEARNEALVTAPSTVLESPWACQGSAAGDHSKRARLETAVQWHAQSTQPQSSVDHPWARRTTQRMEPRPSQCNLGSHACNTGLPTLQPLSQLASIV